jgi:hypothetical protein
MVLRLLVIASIFITGFAAGLNVGSVIERSVRDDLPPCQFMDKKNYEKNRNN